MKENIIATKSVDFAIKSVVIYKKVLKLFNEFVLTKQFLRSSTAIGALVKEAEHAQSPADFIHKMNIALKEANETEYWVLLLFKGGYFTEDEYNEYTKEANELIRILASIVKTSKEKLYGKK